MTFSKRLCDISFSAQRLFYFAGVSKLNFRRGVFKTAMKNESFLVLKPIFFAGNVLFLQASLGGKGGRILETLLGQNQNFPLESGMLYWCFWTYVSM